jgi:hypothetical protein
VLSDSVDVSILSVYRAVEVCYGAVNVSSNFVIDYLYIIYPPKIEIDLIEVKRLIKVNNIFQLIIKNKF